MATITPDDFHITESNRIIFCTVVDSSALSFWNIERRAQSSLKNSGERDPGRTGIITLYISQSSAIDKYPPRSSKQKPTDGRENQIWNVNDQTDGWTLNWLKLTEFSPEKVE
jgi:hypothetical protein